MTLAATFLKKLISFPGFVCLAVFVCAPQPMHAVARNLRSGEVSLTALASAGKIAVTTVGTGNSIGHVADLRIANLTGERMAVPVPAMLLESRSRRFQHYACPHAQTVSLGAHGTRTVPIDGVCLVRTKPPVGKGVTGELIVCDGNPATPRDPDSHFTAKEAGKLTRVAKSYCDAADKLEREGAFRDIPYREPKKRKEIATQWGVWSDPKIATITHEKRATKQDFKRTIIRQAEKKEPLTVEKRQELDRGIDEIFKQVQLTGKEAKTLEEPDPFAGVELTGPKAKAESA